MLGIWGGGGCGQGILGTLSPCPLFSLSPVGTRAWQHCARCYGDSKVVARLGLVVMVAPSHMVRFHVNWGSDLLFTELHPSRPLCVILPAPQPMGPLPSLPPPNAICLPRQHPVQVTPLYPALPSRWLVPCLLLDKCIHTSCLSSWCLVVPHAPQVVTNAQWVKDLMVNQQKQWGFKGQESEPRRASGNTSSGSSMSVSSELML